MGFLFLDWRDVPAKPHLELRLPRLHRSGNTDAVATHNWARMNQPGQGGLPAEVRARFNVPVDRQRPTFIDAARARPSELSQIGDAGYSDIQRSISKWDPPPRANRQGVPAARCG